MHVVTIPIVTLGLFALSVGTGVRAVEAPAQPPQKPLEGIWVLNEDLSDNPQATSWGDRSDTQRGDRQGGARGAEGRPGSGDGPGGDRPDPNGTAAMREAAMSALVSAPRRITIVATEHEVLVTDDAGRVIRLIPDDQEHAGMAGAALEVIRRTKWDGDQLVTQIRRQSRMKLGLQQTYDVRPERPQLVITTRFVQGREPGSDKDHHLRFIYDQAVRSSSLLVTAR